MSLCTCMKGYFLAVDESLSTAFSDVMEQTLTIGATVLLFWRLAPQSLEAALLCRHAGPPPWGRRCPFCAAGQPTAAA